MVDLSALDRAMMTTTRSNTSSASPIVAARLAPGAQHSRHCVEPPGDAQPSSHTAHSVPVCPAKHVMVALGGDPGAGGTQALVIGHSIMSVWALTPCAAAPAGNQNPSCHQMSAPATGVRQRYRHSTTTALHVPAPAARLVHSLRQWWGSPDTSPRLCC